MFALPPFSRRRLLQGAAALSTDFAFRAIAQEVSPTFAYVGCYTARGRGIYIYRVDPSTGRWTDAGVVPAGDNPSFIALDPMRRYLYVVNEVGTYEGRPTGSVTAFAVNPSAGGLTMLNRQSSEGRSPAHVSVDATGRWVLVATYTGGTVTVLPIRADGSLGPATQSIQHTGTLGPNTGRQEAPHAHMILPDTWGRFVMANDLSLDRTFVYWLDQYNGTLARVGEGVAEPGAGPRHLAYHPNGRFVFVINELDNTITSWAYNGESGAMSRVQRITTLPDWWAGFDTTAQILVHPNGRFVYGSNRGMDSIAVFAVNPTTGILTAVSFHDTYGQQPRNFNIDPTGKFLYVANMNSDNIFNFQIDQNTGSLTFAGLTAIPGQPSCIAFSAPLAMGNAAMPGVSFTASPIWRSAGSDLGQTTLSWYAPGANDVEIKVGSATGPTMGRNPTFGSTSTGAWVAEGQMFYLVDGATGSTLASVRAR